MTLQSIYLFSGNTLHAVQRGLAGRLLEAEVVVGRSLCTYFRLDAQGIPKLKRAAYLQLQLPAQAIYAHSGFYASQQANFIHVWVWDQALVDAAVHKQGLGKVRLHCVPETVGTVYAGVSAALNPCATVHTGSATGAGFEGLLFSAERTGWPGTAGALVQSAWWPERPNKQQWAAFSGLSVAPTVLAHTQATLGARLKPKMRALATGQVRNAMVHNNATGAGGMAGTLVKLPWAVLALALCAAGLCFYAGALAKQYVDLEAQQGQLKIQTAAATDSVAGERVTKARSDQEIAQTANLWAVAAQGYFDSPDVMGLWTYLAKPLARQGVLLREFDYRAGELQFLLISPLASLDLPLVLSIFDGSPQLTNIVIEPTQDASQLRIKARFRTPGGTMGVQKEARP
jgi:hypothetical protein